MLDNWVCYGNNGDFFPTGLKQIVPRRLSLGVGSYPLLKRDSNCSTEHVTQRKTPRETVITS